MPHRNAKPQKRNKLLGLLSKPAQASIVGDCELVELGLRDMLYEANQPIANAYFPLTGVVSMIATLDNGSEIEVATTGNEGMVGLPLFLGTNQTPLAAVEP